MIEYKEQTGKFIKECPCSPETVSCGYLNINLHTGCPFNCSYCILQTYLEDSTQPVFFTNFAKLRTELEALSTQRDKIRIGTGELSDSLAFDLQTNYSSKILDIFQDFPEIVFEFKTKSTIVSNILSHPVVHPNIVMAWSLNPEEIIRVEEPQAPSLKNRLQAIEAIQNRGYKIAIHFDPMIITGNWKEKYKNLIKIIAATVDPSRIAWWSLGALRFPYSLRNHIFKHKKSELFYGELIKGYDGKYRYLKELRLELFSYVLSRIYSYFSRELPLYLCMEDEEIWTETLPGIHPDPLVINNFLYESAMD
jgi:spore photoproduct lyase